MIDKHTLDMKPNDVGLYDNKYSCTESPSLQGIISVTHGFTESGAQGFNTPDYGRRKKRGELIPYTKWTQYRAFGSAQGFYDVTLGQNSCGSNRRHYYSTGDYPFNIDWIRTHVDLEAAVTSRGIDYTPHLTNASANVYAKGWDMLTFLVEVRKVPPMFKALAQRVKKLKKKSFKKDDFFVEPEAQYGWAQLGRDAQDIIDFINGKGALRTEFPSGRSGYTDVWKDDPGPTVEVETHGRTIETHTYTEYTVSARASVVAKFVPSNFHLNPFKTGWEIVPYSFVIDWFVNVGRWIDSLSMLTVAQDWTACVGYEAEARHFSSYATTAWESDTSGTSQTSGNSYVKLTKRTPVGDIPLYPSLDVRLDANNLRMISQLMSKGLRL